MKGGAIPRIAVFHPFAEGGGGGEKVLWATVDALQEAATGGYLRGNNDAIIEVFVGNIDKAREAAFRAGASLEGVRFRRLASAPLLRPGRYPWAALLLELIAGFVAGLELLLRSLPSVMVDTQGCSLSYPVASFFGATQVAYIHYPAVRRDMAAVKAKAAKRMYAFGLVWLYGLCLGSAWRIIANSTWTATEIRKVLPPRARKRGVSVVHPPADIDHLMRLPLAQRRPYVVSLGQFRPEKAQDAQVRAWALSGIQDDLPDARLIILGGCRNAQDAERAEGVRSLAAALGVGQSVTLVTNAGREEVDEWLSLARCGLHTMEWEHFGIAVVEFMAAGLVPIVHNSGGPAVDVAPPWANVGVRAETTEEFAKAIRDVLMQDENSFLSQAEKSRERASLFSERAFKQGVRELLPHPLGQSA